MKKLAAFVAVVIIASLGWPSAADATITFAQQVKLRNDPGPFVYHYSSFANGYGACQNCSAEPPIGSGKLTITPRTYRLVEQNKKYDYYLVDTTVQISKHSGPRGAGVLKAQVGTTNAANFATYSSGHHQTAQDCHTYSVSIAGTWGPISVGTDVGSFSTCTNSTLSHSAAKNSQKYSVTNMNGIRNVTFQRFVRVLAGRHPTFRVDVRWPRDYCRGYQVSTGFETFCSNASVHKTILVGVNGNG